LIISPKYAWLASLKKQLSREARGAFASRALGREARGAFPSRALGEA
jgi:hypothetical protein